MNKDKALDILRTINYPGFNRDIVSFGMVKNVSIDGNNIKVNLNITSQNEKLPPNLWIISYFIGIDCIKKKNIKLATELCNPIIKNGNK